MEKFTGLKKEFGQYSNLCSYYVMMEKATFNNHNIR